MKIEGLIVPFGPVGYASLDGTPAQLVYEPGSLVWDDPNDVTLVVDHDDGHPTYAGRAVKLTETKEGIYGEFRLIDTNAGRDAKVEADENVRGGLSIEADCPNIPADPTGVYRFTAANPGTLRRVALVETPAFSEARVRKVTAAATTQVAAEKATAAEVPDEALTEVIGNLTSAVNVLTSTLGPQDAAPAAAGHTGGGVGPADIPSVKASVSVLREAFPYGHPGAEGQSFFKDLVHAREDPQARERTAKATKMWDEANEARAYADFMAMDTDNPLRKARAADEPVPKANVFIPNNYDQSLYPGQVTFPRRLVDPTPRTAISSAAPFLYPYIGTGPTADGGSGEVVIAHTEGTNEASGEVDIDTATATPIPYAGKFDINREAIDAGSPGMDQILFGFLDESYNQVTELAAWTALYATSGITSPTSVATNADLSIEARAMNAQIRAEIVAFDARRGVSPDALIYGSGVFSAAVVADSTATSGEPLYPYHGPMNRDGLVTGRGAVVIDNLGIPGYQSAKATSSKVAEVLFNDLHVWESPMKHFRWEEVAGPAKIRFVNWAYFVFKVIQPLGVTVHTQL